MKKWTIKAVNVLLVMILAITLYRTFEHAFVKPKNTLELYQTVTFADNLEQVAKQFLTGDTGSFNEDDLAYMREHSAVGLSQFSLFEYTGKTYVVLTTPGTHVLKIHAIEELPEDIESYFISLMDGMH